MARFDLHPPAHAVSAPADCADSNAKRAKPHLAEPSSERLCVICERRSRLSSVSTASRALHGRERIGVPAARRSACGRQPAERWHDDGRPSPLLYALSALARGASRSAKRSR